MQRQSVGKPALLLCSCVHLWKEGFSPAKAFGHGSLPTKTCPCFPPAPFSPRAAPLLAIRGAESPVKALTLSWPSDLLCACREPPFVVPKSPGVGIWRKRRRGCISRSAKVRGRCSRGSCSQVCICRGSVKSGHAASSTLPGVSAQSSGAKRQLVTASPLAPGCELSLLWAGCSGLFHFSGPRTRRCSLSRRSCSVAAPICKPDPPMMSACITSRCRRKPLLSLPSKSVMGEELWEQPPSSKPVTCLSCTDILMLFCASTSLFKTLSVYKIYIMYIN